MERLAPMEAATRFIRQNFPNCDGALLAGSVVRGQETSTSDLDIIVFDSVVKKSYRESIMAFGWPIEVFVHNLTSYKEFFESDCKRARPSLPRMVAEGVTILDKGELSSIIKEAQWLLEKGPEKWSSITIEVKRYFITDVLNDFIGATDRAEEIFIANTLADYVSEFVLRTNNRWIGSSKWIIRSLREFDEEFTHIFVDAFDTYYRTGNKLNVVDLVEGVLEPYGGRLFEGYSIGKE